MHIALGKVRRQSCLHSTQLAQKGQRWGGVAHARPLKHMSEYHHEPICAETTASSSKLLSIDAVDA